jgi:hypothetical protein
MMAQTAKIAVTKKFANPGKHLTTKTSKIRNSRTSIIMYTLYYGLEICQS